MRATSDWQNVDHSDDQQKLITIESDAHTTLALSSQTLFRDRSRFSDDERQYILSVPTTASRRRGKDKTTPSSKQGVKSNLRKLEFGPHPSGSRQKSNGLAIDLKGGEDNEHDRRPSNGARDMAANLPAFNCQCVTSAE